MLCGYAAAARHRGRPSQLTKMESATQLVAPAYQGAGRARQVKAAGRPGHRNLAEEEGPLLPPLTHGGWRSDIALTSG